MSVQDQFGQQARQGMSTKSKAGIVLVGFLIIAFALLFTEHKRQEYAPHLKKFDGCSRAMRCGGSR